MKKGDGDVCIVLCGLIQRPAFDQVCTDVFALMCVFALMHETKFSTTKFRPLCPESSTALYHDCYATRLHRPTPQQGLLF